MRRVPEHIAVVGASAAGIYTALVLAREGMRVSVLEQSGGLEPVPRTLIVTGHMREVLGGLGESAVVNEVRRYELFADGRVATVDLARPDLVIERSTLIRELGRAAHEAGAKFEFSSRVTGLAQVGESPHLVVRGPTGSEFVATDTIVGADGANSRLARAAGWPQQQTIPLLQAVVQLPSDMEPGVARVWFRPGETRYFYWLIPHGDGRGALGVVGEDRAATRQSLDRFLEDKSLEPISYQAARTPVYRRWVPIHRRVRGADVYVVGDAAGHVKVTTVGGIVTGFRGAMAVAASILADGSRARRSLRRELELHRAVRSVLHRFDQDDYVAMIDLLESPARGALSQYTRDEAGRLLWRLIRSEPRFAWLTLRGLLRRT